MSALKDVVAYEESVLAGSARLRGIHADAVRRGRAAVLAAEAEAGTDHDALDDRLDALYADVLDEYAARANPEISEEQEQAWLRAVAGLQRHAWSELLTAHGVLGAARLLMSLDGVRGTGARTAAPDRRLAAAAKTCVCGHATDGTMPRWLCQSCSHALSAAWVDEESSLLQRAPGLQAEVAGILEAVGSEISAARALGTEDSYTVEEAALSGARRRLARANRRHRDEVSRLDLTRWRELAGLVRRSSMPTMRSEARRARRRLGMAGLSRLAVRGSGGS
jgi:hypothetical protein